MRCLEYGTHIIFLKTASVKHPDRKTNFALEHPDLDPFDPICKKKDPEKSVETLI